MQHKAFCKRLGKSVHLDSGVAEMLSGDFVHDAIVLKVEQLVKQEVCEMKLTSVTHQSIVGRLKHWLRSKPQSILFNGN